MLLRCSVGARKLPLSSRSAWSAGIPISRRVHGLEGPKSWCALFSGSAAAIYLALKPLSRHGARLIPNVHSLVKIHRSLVRQTATMADEVAEPPRPAGQERFEVVLHRALMLLALVWPSRPIARIGCCESPQPTILPKARYPKPRLPKARRFFCSRRTAAARQGRRVARCSPTASGTSVT